MWKRTAKDIQAGNYIGEEGEFSLTLTLPQVNKKNFGKKN